MFHSPEETIFERWSPFEALVAEGGKGITNRESDPRSERKEDVYTGEDGGGEGRAGQFRSVVLQNERQVDAM